MKTENGRIIKNNVKLIEYGDGSTQIDNYFIQVGVAGLYLSKKELDDLYTALSYYLNIEEFLDCQLEFK